MLLAVDIGNTNIVMALHNGKEWTEQIRVKTKTPSAQALVLEHLRAIGTGVDHAVVSSVVPDMTGPVTDAVKTVFGLEPVAVSAGAETGLVKASIPPETGADLICNLAAAHRYFPENYVTVADFGTAFTTATVGPDGRVLGITIAPGMMTSVKALFENTAQLPQIRLDLPDTVLGLDTVSSIRAGVLYGFTGQLNAVVKKIEEELGHRVKLVVTGGFSRYIKPYVENIALADINFTLEGARMICLMNS